MEDLKLNINLDNEVLSDKESSESDNFKIMYISKNTDDKKFIAAVLNTIERGIIPIIKVSGNDIISKLVKNITILNSILKDKYVIFWDIQTSIDKGKKDGADIRVVNFTCIFKEYSRKPSVEKIDNKIEDIENLTESNN
jgi:hypothetical protein